VSSPFDDATVLIVATPSSALDAASLVLPHAVSNESAPTASAAVTRWEYQFM
jgi:hypothetical protein